MKIEIKENVLGGFHVELLTDNGYIIISPLFSGKISKPTLALLNNAISLVIEKNEEAK
jgi:hypothetical protein